MIKLRLSEATDDSAYGVAIVGGGISGLYCAWRLLEHNADQKIAVIERLNHPIITFPMGAPRIQTAISFAAGTSRLPTPLPASR